jgi:hypothetical protein
MLGYLHCFCPVSNFRSISTKNIFYGVGLSAPLSTFHLEEQGIAFVWAITFDLPGLGGHTSSYATASIALRIISPHKSHHYVKVGIPLEGYCLDIA